MKLLAVILSIVVAIELVSAQCSPGKPDVPTIFKDMGKKCVNEMIRQIQEEIDASTVYMAMGAHFSRDIINRPGFSKFFFHAAHEERDHAQALIGYLLTRGELDGEDQQNGARSISQLITVPKVDKTVWPTGVEALRDALKKEAAVTKSIKRVIKVCDEETLPEKFIKEFNLVDYLSGDFLNEQYEGQRDLAGKISTLDKMMKTHPELGEFLFDKELLG